MMTLLTLRLTSFIAVSTSLSSLPPSYINQVVRGYLEFQLDSFSCPSDCLEACDCVGTCLSYTNFAQLSGDDVCQNLADHSVTFNCYAFDYDMQRCTAGLPAPLSCDGLSDCYGTCVLEAECQGSYNITCETMGYWLMSDGVCQTIEADGLVLNCPKFGFDGGACGGASRTRALRSDREMVERRVKEIIFAHHGQRLEEEAVQKSKFLREFNSKEVEIGWHKERGTKLERRSAAATSRGDDGEGDGDDDSDLAPIGLRDAPLLQGGWIGGSRSVGGAILVQMRIKKREACLTDVDDTSIFPICNKDEDFTAPLEIPGRYITNYNQGDSTNTAYAYHNEIFDMGRWNVGLQQMFCSIEKLRVFFLDKNLPIWVSEMKMQVPIYNGNVNDGVFALGTLTFGFANTDTVDINLSVRTYKLNGLMDMSEGETKLRIRLEIFVFLLWAVLFYKAGYNLRDTGPHLMNIVTILSSILFLAIMLTWGFIGELVYQGTSTQAHSSNSSPRSSLYTHLHWSQL